MTDKSQQFASDNYSGICPEAWAAMEQANQGHQRAYGDDEWTHRAADEVVHLRARVRAARLGFSPRASEVFFSCA